VRRASASEQRPQRSKSVVADPARPEQVPQNGRQLLVVGAGHGVGEGAEEEGTTSGERIQDGAVKVGEIELL